MNAQLNLRFFALLCALLSGIASLPAHAGLFGGGSDDPIKAESLKALKKNNVTHLAIPSFTVIFHTKANKTASSKHGLFSSNKANAKSAMFVEWKDPDLGVLQKITDEAYRSFAGTLAESGMDVVPMEQLVASEPYAKINGSSEPVRDEKMISVAPTGMKVYDPIGKIDPNGSFFLGMGNMNGKLESEAAKAVLGNLDGVATARVVVNVAFGTFDAEANTVVGDYDTASAKVSFVPVVALVQSSPTVTPMISGIELFSNFDTNKLPNGTEFSMPKDTSRIQLNVAQTGDKPVCSIKEVTTAGEKAGVAIANVIGMLSALGGGTGGSIDAGSYEASVDSEAFKSQAGLQIAKLASLIGDKLKADE